MNNKEYVLYACYGSNLCLERFMKYINNCIDKTPPSKNLVVTIPYEMYFGNKSRSWDDGGVCFIDAKKNENVKTIARAYLVTYEQYLAIQKQEGDSDSWYGNTIVLGNIDGHRALTFTSRYRHHYNRPCNRYIDYVKRGLVECGLTEEDAIAYLENKLK